MDRWLSVQPSVTASGFVGRVVTGAILQRVRLSGTGMPEILENETLKNPTCNTPWSPAYMGVVFDLLRAVGIFDNIACR